MKGLGVSLLVALLLVLLAIEDTASVSRSIDPSYNWPSSVRASSTFGFFFFACTEKDDDRGSEENYQESEESLQQEERHPQRYYAFSRMDASRNQKFLPSQLVEKNVGNLRFRRFVTVTLDNQKFDRDRNALRFRDEIHFVRRFDEFPFSRKFDPRLTLFRAELLDGQFRGEFPQDERLMCYMKCIMIATKAVNESFPINLFLRHSRKD